jgi:hypothetical protein
MSAADLVNGSFELLAGLFSLNNCRATYKAKRVVGVSPVSTAFFTAWGFWNLYYYPALGQWLSFYGGLSIVLANMLWLYLMIHYRRNTDGS